MFERMPKYSMSDELGDLRMLMVRLSTRVTRFSESPSETLVCSWAELAIDQREII